MIRIASLIRVVPSALRAISSPKILSDQYSITNYAFRRSTNQNSCFRQINCSISFSTDAKKQIDRKLVEILQSEIESDQSPPLEKIMPPTPPDFPFAIEDKPTFHHNITLTRELDGEKIEVVVHKPLDIRPDDDGEESDSGDNNDGKSDDDNNEEKEKSPLKLCVLISKENGKKMELSVSASTDDITVDMISAIEPAAAEADDPLRFGPFLIKKESELHFALKEFLEIRGLKKSHAGFLYEYMLRKSKRIQHKQVLEELKEFIEKQ